MSLRNGASRSSAQPPAPQCVNHVPVQPINTWHFRGQVPCIAAPCPHISRRRHQRLLQQCAAIEQDVELQQQHANGFHGAAVLHRQQHNGGLLHPLHDVQDVALHGLDMDISQPQVTPRKRLNKQIKACRSLLELRVLLERDHVKFDHINTSNALTQLAKLQRALHEQLSKAGLLTPESAERHRHEHVKPCLKVLDILTKRHTEHFDAWGVSATLWAYSSLDHYDRTWFDALCSRALKLQTSMKPTDAANILTAFGRWGHYHPELIRSLPQVILDQMYDAKPGEVSQCLWSLARLRVPGVPGRPFLIATCEMIHNNMYAFGNQEISNVLWALVKLQFYPGLSFLQRAESVILRRLRAQKHRRLYSNNSTVQPQHDDEHVRLSENHQGQHAQHNDWHDAAAYGTHHAGSRSASVNGNSDAHFTLHPVTQDFTARQQPHIDDHYPLQPSLHSHIMDHSNGWEPEPAQQHSLQPAMLRPQDIGNVLWAFGKMRYKAVWLLDELPLSLGSWLHEFSATDLCCVLVGYANARHYHKGVLEAVASILSNNIQSLGLNQLMSCLVAYSVFQHRPVCQSQFFQRLAVALKCRMHDARPKTYALISKAFANLQLRPEALLNDIVQDSLNRIEQFKPEEMAHLLYGLSYLVSRAPFCELRSNVNGQTHHTTWTDSSTGLQQQRITSQMQVQPAMAGSSNTFMVYDNVSSTTTTTSSTLHPALKPEEMQLFLGVVKQCLNLLNDPTHQYATPKHLHHQVLNSIVFSCLRIGYTPWTLIEFAETKGFRVTQPKAAGTAPYRQSAGEYSQGYDNSARFSGRSYATRSSHANNLGHTGNTQQPAHGGMGGSAQQGGPPKAYVTVPGHARRGQHAAPPLDFDAKAPRRSRSSSGMARPRLFDMTEDDDDEQQTDSQPTTPPPAPQYI